MDENGVLLALDRDLARQVFGCRNDESLRRLVSELRSELPGGERCLDLGTRYAALAEAYEAAATEKKPSSPLAMVIRGGRPMHQGPEWTITMVRPDLTGIIAEELAELDLKPQLSETSGNQAKLEDLTREVAAFYRAAGERADAVLFSVKRTV